MIRFYLFIFSLFTLLPALAQSTLSGSLKNHVDKNIYVFTYADELSQKRVLIGKTTIGAEGKFKMELPNSSKTVRYFVLIGNAEGILYAEPNKAYVIQYFPDANQSGFQRFDRNTVVIEYADLNAEDCNVLIPAFNKDLFAFLDEHFYDFAVEKYRGSEAYRKRVSTTRGNDLSARKDSASTNASEDSVSFTNWVEQFRLKMVDKYEHGFKNHFFNTHFRYSIAELEMMSGVTRKALYEEYLMSQEVQINHPSYMKFFMAFYDHCLENKKPLIQEQVIKYVNADRDPQQLYDLLLRDSLFFSPTVGQLALLVGLQDIYGNKTYVKGAIDVVLQRCQEMPCCNIYKTIARNLSDNFKAGKAGQKIEDFSIFTPKLDKWKLSEEQKGYCYFFFFTDWNASCKKELQMMQKLHEKYKSDISFYAISMDDHVDDLKRFMQSNREMDFTFLFAGNNPEIKESLMVRSIPHAIMIDPNSNLMYEYTRKPSEGIQTEFENISKKLRSPANDNSWKGK